MDPFNKKKIQALEKRIQAQEGAQSNVILESLLTSTALNSTGVENQYLSYASQTQAIYQKYLGKSQLGNAQLRSIIDTRTGFIAGEGLSVICKDQKTGDFINEFMRNNKLHGSRFINSVKQGEMEGRVLQYIRPDKKTKNIKIFRHLSDYSGGAEYEVKYADKNDPDSIIDVLIKQKDGTKKSLRETFVFSVTGGYNSTTQEPSTRAGLCLWEMESVARTLNAMRKNNHLFGKVTPVFNSDNANDVAIFRSLAKSKDWKIGDVISALKGDFKLVVPAVGAMENLTAEQVACTKVIAGITGIPVHWFGYVDLMSNRATAESLYETINNATILDRTIWQETYYDLFIKAQEMAIDNGYFKGAVNYDFEVKIPLMSFSKMYDNIKSLSLAYADDAISIQDYRNHLPGIDPYKTAQLIDDEIEKDALTGLKSDRSIDDGKSDDGREEETGPPQKGTDTGKNG